MKPFNPEKLFVSYNSGIAATGPIFPRYYTLTHSDDTGELFLVIGPHYAWANTDAKREEVLGTWIQYGSKIFYYVYLYLDQGEYHFDVVAKRNEIFRQELPLALRAIRYGDRFLFDAYPQLNQAPIIVNFISAYPQFAKQENWGTFHSFSYKSKN